MAPFIHLSGRSRLMGLAALVATALVAVALGQAPGQLHQAAATPRHTAVTIQRATAVAVGQIARPTKTFVPLETRNPGGAHRHKKGG
jgi:hypothetical protein